MRVRIPPGAHEMKKLSEYIHSQNKTHLIFDFDETIGKLLFPWDEWFVDVADKLKKEYPNFNENDYVLIHNKLVERHGSEALKLIRSLNEKFETEKLQGFERNEELIEFIKNNPEFNYYIWSSNSEKTVKKFLKELDLDSIFKKIVSRTNSRFIKPNPSGFGLIKDDNVPSHKYLFIGDSSSDRKTAEKIGIDFFLIDYFGGSF